MRSISGGRRAGVMGAADARVPKVPTHDLRPNLMVVGASLKPNLLTAASVIRPPRTAPSLRRGWPIIQRNSSAGQNLTGSFLDAECCHGRSCKAFGSITAGQEEISAASEPLMFVELLPDITVGFATPSVVAVSVDERSPTAMAMPHVKLRQAQLVSF